MQNEPRRFVEDDRALSYQIVLAFVAIVLFAFTYMLLSSPIDAYQSIGLTSTAEGSQMAQWFGMLWAWLPVLVALVFMFAFIARAAWEAR